MPPIRLHGEHCGFGSAFHSIFRRGGLRPSRRRTSDLRTGSGRRGLSAPLNESHTPIACTSRFEHTLGQIRLAAIIAVALLIFGGGIYNLFVREVDNPAPGTQQLLEIKSISQLKRVLAELIIVIVMVKFLEQALHSIGSYQWEMLILPADALMMAVAVKVLGLRELCAASGDRPAAPGAITAGILFSPPRHSLMMTYLDWPQTA
jgi:hypothetical protein